MTEFTAPPPGMLSEQIDLPSHEMTLGLMHPEEGLRICVWDGLRLRHLTHDAAVKWAQELEAEKDAAMFAPVSRALRTLAAKVNGLETSTMFRRAARTAMQKFADMPVEGRA